MTPQELKAFLANIVAELNGVADFAGVLAPQFAAYIAIGKAIDTQIPGLAAMVDSWIQGNPPTPEELADFGAKLKVLNDPNLP
jgi:hypothetical protein